MAGNNIPKVCKAAVLSFFWDFVRELKPRTREVDQAGFYRHLKTVNLEEKRDRRLSYVKDKNGVLSRDDEPISERWVRWFHTLLSAKSQRLDPNMDMMSQLLEAKSAGRGQQREEEESGGTGRGGAHNYSGGAGRTSPTADTGYGITVVRAAAAVEVPVHSSRVASEPTRPADGIGRRTEVLPGVSPTLNIYSGKATESHLAGIAAHDGGSGVLNTSCRRPPRVIPPALKVKRASKSSSTIFF